MPNRYPRVGPSPVWLSRDAMPLQLHYTLCLNSADFERMHGLIGTVTPSGPWMSNPKAGATCHPFYDKTGRLHIIVTLDDKGRNGLDVAGILCHEAVHIWQFHCDEVGEKQSFGDEHMAWTIQHITLCLLYSYKKQRKL